MKRILSFVLGILLAVSFAACESTPAVPEQEAPSVVTEVAGGYLDASCTTEERVADLLSKMSLADKAGQMVQGEQYPVTEQDMKKLGLGSVLSGGGSVPDNNNTVAHWKQAIDGFQKAALSRELKIPFLYGADAVHGHNTVYGAVIFPHNIGIGAANDTELTQQMGAYVAEDMKLTGILWNFAPCVAVVQDPRWGRTYESYSSDPDIVCELAAAFSKGQMESGVLPCAKHYVADGGVTFGTGEGGYLIDRGDAQMSEEELRAVHLAPYARLVEDGVKSVMVSFSSFQGLKMHEHKYLITDVLKDELGFDGFVISDFEGVLGINAPTYEAQIAAAINAGVDMLMEPYCYRDAIDAIVSGVETGAVSQERVDDAVKRILTVKLDLGLFDDPYLDNMPIGVSEIGSGEGRALAKKLVEKSQVLLKNDNNVLPFKRGQKIYITGPAADNVGIMCGGWTLSWQGLAEKDLTPGTTIMQSLLDCADEYGLTIITDESQADEADVVLMVLGEKPYAEYEGDAENLSITGDLALQSNGKAMEKIKTLGKPIVTLIVAGRNVLIDDYIGEWDAAVMSYLPGTEGDGVISPLVGACEFTGKLPMPWYRSEEDIGKQNADLLFELGYGLTY
jgi:beta-glucosidase